MIAARSAGEVYDAVVKHGVAPGGQKMMDNEMAAAKQAIETGTYVVWRNEKGNDCTRVAPTSLCFCGCTFADHLCTPRKQNCTRCSCKWYSFIPARPEEVGMWWLVRRPDFDIRTWQCKCKCKHGHRDHDPATKKCRACSCFTFTSDFLCVACDKHWEEHETVYESEAERIAAGKPIGDDFKPLAETPAIQAMVFDPTRIRFKGKPRPRGRGRGRGGTRGRGRGRGASAGSGAGAGAGSGGGVGVGAGRGASRTRGRGSSRPSSGSVLGGAGRLALTDRRGGAGAGSGSRRRVGDAARSPDAPFPAPKGPLRR